MKNTFSFLLGALLLVGCSEEPTPEQLEGANAIVEAFEEEAAKRTDDKNWLHEIKARLQGDWYDVGYMETIAKTKSPFASWEAPAEMIEMNFDSTLIDDGRWEIGAFGIHEGLGFTCFPSKNWKTEGLSTNLIDYNDQTNFYMIQLDAADENALTVARFDQKHKLLDEVRYKKAEPNEAGAFASKVNETLLVGTYKGISLNEEPIHVNFTADGKVDGFENFKTYRILTDFVAADETAVDEICFEIQTDKQQCFPYEIIGDTVYLYERNKEDLSIFDAKLTLIKTVIN